MRPYNDPIEISTISRHLEKLAASAILDTTAMKACEQASYLLKTMRAMILTGETDDAIVSELRHLLAMQGEG